MNVEVKDVDQCVKEMTITIPSEDALKDYHAVLQKFKNYVVVPGFRKGKAPLSMVDNLFFEQARESYLKEKVYDYYEKALADKDIKPLYEGMPTNIDWERGKDLIMVFRYEVEPTVEITKYTDLEVPYLHTEFSDDMIDSTIENIRKNMAKEETIEGPAEKGDLLIINMENLEEDSEKGHLLLDVTEIRLMDNQFGEDLNKALTAVKKDEVIDTIYKEEGKEFKVRITVKEIKRMAYPEVNEEFARESDFESLEMMRQEIKNNLLNQVENNNKREKQKGLLLKLIEYNPFDVPPTAVVSYSHKLAEPYARLLNKKPEDIASYYTKTAYFEIKGYYIVSSLMNNLALEVGEEDQQQLIKELAEELNLKVEEYLEKNPDVTKKEEFVNRLKEKKLFEYLTENNRFIPKQNEAELEEVSNNETSEDKQTTGIEE